MKEEITAEGLTRNVPAFARFLEVAAACSGKMINKTEVASDVLVLPWQVFLERLWGGAFEW